MLRCGTCGQDIRFGHLCLKPRERLCYECHQEGHNARDCPSRGVPKSAAPLLLRETVQQPELTFHVRPCPELRVPDVEPSAEWIWHGTAETFSDALPAKRKRPATPVSPSSGPSHGLQPNLHPAGPPPSVESDSGDRPIYIDTHCHPDLMKHFGVRASDWSTERTGVVRFGGAIACFAYPALYLDCNNLKQDRLSRLLRSLTVERLLNENDLIPLGALLGAQFGCHPRSADEWILGDEATPDGRSFLSLQKIFQQPYWQPIRPLAVGETGLDTSDDSVPPLETQRRVFRELIRVADEFSVPIVLHLRGDNDSDVRLDYVAMAMLEAGAKREQKIHRHCFRHSSAVANEWRHRFPNTKFGITGALLNRERRFQHEVEFAKSYPLEHLVLETDSPFFAMSRRNNPTNVVRVAEEIARLRGIDVRVVIRATTRNAENLYGIRSSC